MTANSGWIGVDLDGTLAHYEGWPKDGGVGEPIPLMLDRVKKWLEEGQTVKIFTARVGPQRSSTDGDIQRGIIEAWCEQHLGQKLDVTATKDFSMIALWDDRAIQVETNTGKVYVELD